jgi:hypothetical protein
LAGGTGGISLWRDILDSFCRHRKRPAEAGRLCQLRIGIARLLARLFGIFVTTAGFLALLAGFLTTALLLTRLLTRCLILLAGLGWFWFVMLFPFMGTA